MVDRVYQRNAVENAPSAPESPSVGYPVDGDPAQSIPATAPGAYWFHMVTESLRKVIVDQGLTPNHLQLGRLSEAIRRAASESRPGMVRFASLEEHKAGESTEKATNPAGVRAMLNASAYEFEAIGKPFVVFDHLPGVELPSNEGSATFVKLTAGETGPGGYNEGLLINETVATSNGRVVATAEIAGGPNQGGIVHLLNTEGRYIRPGENSGAVEFDQMQRITADSGAADISSADSTYRAWGGAFSGTYQGTSQRNSYGGNGIGRNYFVRFDSADSPGARTGSYTEVMHIEGTAMLRIE